MRTRNRHYQVDWTSTIIAPDGSRVLRSALVFVKVSKHRSSQDGRAFVVGSSTFRALAITAALYQGGHRTSIPLPARVLTVAW